MFCERPMLCSAWHASQKYRMFSPGMPQNRNARESLEGFVAGLGGSPFCTVGMIISFYTSRFFGRPSGSGAPVTTCRPGWERSFSRSDPRSGASLSWGCRFSSSPLNLMLSK